MEQQQGFIDFIEQSINKKLGLKCLDGLQRNHPSIQGCCP